MQADCPAAELERAARTAAALDELVARHSLGGLAYFYSGTGGARNSTAVNENQDTITSIILGTSMLTRRGVPVAGEYEVKNAIAMKIMDSFGAGGSFTEYYAVDFADDVVLMGHDGPGHPGIAEGRVKVKPLAVYHGKVGRGLAVEMRVKNGPVTLLGIAKVEGEIRVADYLLEPKGELRVESLRIGEREWRRDGRGAEAAPALQA